jgi:hypothetical protein
MQVARTHVKSARTESMAQLGFYPLAREAQILWFAASQGFLRRFHRRMCKTGFACRAPAGKGMRCARRGGGQFVQTTENPPGSPGAARGRVLLCKLIVKTCPQITVNWPVSASSILDDAAPPFFCKPQMRRGLASA